MRKLMFTITLHCTVATKEDVHGTSQGSCALLEELNLGIVLCPEPGQFTVNYINTVKKAHVETLVSSNHNFMAHIDIIF